MAATVPEGAALGLLETLGLVAAVEAADAMLKASEVRLVRQQRTNPGLITHLVVGDTAAVRAAVDAGAAAAARVGRVAAQHVIPRPAPDVWRRLVGVEPGGPVPEAAPVAPVDPVSAVLSETAPAASETDYEAMTVRDLRALARDRDDERLQGRAIARASKSELVAFLRRTEAA